MNSKKNLKIKFINLIFYQKIIILITYKLLYEHVNYPVMELLVYT